jgi:hypothetical protein
MIRADTSTRDRRIERLQSLMGHLSLFSLTNVGALAESTLPMAPEETTSSDTTGGLESEHISALASR